MFWKYLSILFLNLVGVAIIGGAVALVVVAWYEEIVVYQGILITIGIFFIFASGIFFLRDGYKLLKSVNKEKDNETD